MIELKELDARAATIIDRGIHSHKVWRDYLKINPNYSTNDVGNIETHEKWIKDYEYLEETLIKALNENKL